MAGKKRRATKNSMTTKVVGKKTEFKLSQRARTFVSVGVGAGIGAVVALLFVEDPEAFFREATKLVNTWNDSVRKGWDAAAAASDVGKSDVGKLWWQRRVTADWYVNKDGKDGVQHSFALCSKGPPGQSACGNIWLDEPMAPSRGQRKKCQQCLSTLKIAGYTVHRQGNIITGGTGPIDQGPPDPRYTPPATKTKVSGRHPKRSKTKKTKR